MSFILRAAFWLTVMAFLLPAAGYESAPQAAGMAGYANAALVEGQPPADNDIGATEALTLAARSAQDVMGFCGRNPDICEKSHAVVGHVLRQTAYYGGQALVWLTEKAREQQHDSTRLEGHQAAIRPAASPLPLAGA
ncbi:hypothetical protein Plav_0878 [Parvibaculum lavamentivorans DS-1]|uniref:UrcA family protein n=1 Tax=Parvibaculum lavamentivorans (strain DS-1 / DSM 13023 / NCIMB 13966) TaxID=402881 RepID=A7HRG8_PARL1|nr:DUF5330 domain-containing protein [Parvibaculum lavamentivorans]ABS62501.1 hypothetical protein Plav_0878 [Parvibaculum lavamentivorans DS-1]